MDGKATRRESLASMMSRHLLDIRQQARQGGVRWQRPSDTRRYTKPPAHKVQAVKVRRYKHAKMLRVRRRRAGVR